MTTECGACLDTYWLMADERAGLCPLCMTPDKMRAARWEGSQAQREADAENAKLEGANARLEAADSAYREQIGTLRDELAERGEYEQADLADHLRCYLVTIGLPADPVRLDDPHLAALYEALAHG